MTPPLTFDGFLDVTSRMASLGDDLLPTVCIPESSEVRMLEGAPEDGDLAQITRDWAADLGFAHYFIAYPCESGVTAEEYDRGQCTAVVALNN